MAHLEFISFHFYFFNSYKAMQSHYTHIYKHIQIIACNKYTMVYKQMQTDRMGEGPSLTGHQEIEEAKFGHSSEKLTKRRDFPG